jgi:hypothetical protein
MLLHTFLLAVGLAVQKPAPPPANIDPSARRVLDGMVRAYRDVRRLEQETAYHRDDPNSGGLVRSRLIVQRPNRLFLEIVQKTDMPQPLLSRFVCDGKNMYAYQQKNGWYTKEKAPKDLKEFDYLALSVEMAALTGNDPVPALARQARSVRLDNPETIDGEPADVVVFDTSSAERFGELRLFINREDHLLRRFAMETRPLPQPAKADAPPLEPGETAAPPPAPTAFSYDVHVMRGREQTKDAFAWVAPAGAFPYQQYPTAFAGTGGKVQPGDPAANMPAGITPMKIISIQDLMKNAKKPNKKK